jgi:hypothetical protein
VHPHGPQGGASARRFGALALLSLFLLLLAPAHDAGAVVPSTTITAQYTVVTGSDVLTVPYYFILSGDLTVTSASHGLLVQGTGYTVTLPTTDGAGGFVTLIGQTINDTITVSRNVPYTQLTQLRGQGTLSPPTLENMTDRSTMQIQQLLAQLQALQTIVNSLAPDGGSCPHSLTFCSPSGTGGIQIWDATLNNWVWLYSSNGQIKLDNVAPP